MNDMPQLFNSKEVKARKDHRCTNCGDNITKGSNYNSMSGLWSGDVRRFKLCNYCNKVVNSCTLIMGDSVPHYACGPYLGFGGVSDFLRDYLTGDDEENADLVVTFAKTFDVPETYIHAMLFPTKKEAGQAPI